MEEVKVWAFIIGNIGIPAAIVCWYFLVERPNQRKREEKMEERFDLKLQQMLDAERATCDNRRVEDKQHALELAKLSGEIHLTASRELREGLNRNSDVVERLEARLERSLSEFSDGIVAVHQVTEEIRKKKS